MRFCCFCRLEVVKMGLGVMILARDDYGHLGAQLDTLVYAYPSRPRLLLNRHVCCGVSRVSSVFLARCLGKKRESADF